MQEWKGIIPQKGNIRVVCQRGEVKRIPKEGGQEIAWAAGEKWKEEELNHV